MTLIGSIRAARGCSGEGDTPRCPIVTFGGSYPGWLSAMMRLRYPNVVDMAYAASAPMNYYAQAVADQVRCGVCVGGDARRHGSSPLSTHTTAS